MIYLDTHVVAWLYAGRRDLLPPMARSLIEDNDLMVSPMVAVELQYLYEVGKTKELARHVMTRLARDIGLAQCDLPYAEVVDAALDDGWTRDPFDRLIVSQARLRGAPLLTKDASILGHYSEAVWE